MALINKSSVWLHIILLVWILPADSQAGDSGDDFTNNLLSDLSPLLALFGEKFAQQFMSQSLGWLDHIIMAMAPLGILTAMVAAIRIGGPSWLKALIGRARENTATAELELMSSTSHDVGELWNGQTIVRTLGSPEVKQLIFVENGESIDSCFGLYTVETAEEIDLIRREVYEDPFLAWHKTISANLKNIFAYQSVTSDNQDIEHDASEKDSSEHNVSRKTLRTAPSISLNLHGGSKTEDLVVAAFCGIFLQLSVLAFSGLTVYHPVLKKYFQKDGRSVESYAFPLMAIGTGILSVGVMVCSAVVEQSTEETKWTLQNDIESSETGAARILWLQKSHTVSDQNFDSFVIVAPKPKHIILSSQRTRSQENSSYIHVRDGSMLSRFKRSLTWIASNKFEGFTVVGVGLTFIGFVLQFQALRGLHWSTALSQLTAIFLMTVLRAWVRRGLIAEPNAHKVLEGYEMDWLSTNLVLDQKFWSRGNLAEKLTEDNASETSIPPMSTLSSSRTSLLHASRGWHIKTGPRSSSLVGSWYSQYSSTKAQRAMKVRQRLGNLTRWSGPSSKPAISVARAVTLVMKKLSVESSVNRTPSAKSADRSEMDKRQPPTKSARTKTLGKLHGVSLPVRKFKKAETQCAELANPQTFYWFLDVSFDDEVSRIEFKVTRNDDGDWETDATEIESAISLWAFQIESKERECPTNHVRSRHRKTTGNAKEDWLQQNTKLNRSTKKILGPNVDSLRASISLWIGQHLDIQTTESIDENTLFVGFNGPQFRNDAHEHQSALYVVSEAPLEQLLAQHIFSAFMWAVAPSVPSDRIDADSTRITAEDNKDKNIFASCENMYLAELANSLQRFGLGSREDALLCMVPPLSCNNKLPVNIVVDFTRRQTRDLEKTGNWDVVVDQHINLFKFCYRFGLQHVSTHRSAAALADLSQKINATLRLWKSHNYQEKKIKELSSLRKRLRRSSSSLDQEFVGNLMSIMGISYKIDRNLENLRRGQLTTTEDAHKFFRHSKFLTRFHALTKRYTGQTSKELEAVFAGMLEDVNSTDIFNRTALHYAANSGHEALVSFLLNREANIHAIDIQDNTPLHTACEAGREGVIRTLLESEKAPADIKAYINAGGRYGSSPLHLAARAGDLKSVRLLIWKGAQINIPDDSQRTPLHWAAFHGWDTIVELLLRRDAPTSARDEHGRTPLLSAIYGYNCLKLQNDKTIKKILEHRVDTNLADNDGKISLHLVAEKNSCDLAKLLLKLKNGRKPNVNALDYHGRSPLHYASMAGHEDMCITLLEYDADMIIEDNEGRTPFDLAARHQCKGVVDILVGTLFTIIGTETSDKSTCEILQASIDKERYDIIPPLLKALKLPSPSDSASLEGTTLRKSARIETETIVDILVTLVILYGEKLSDSAKIAARELLWIKDNIESYASIDKTLSSRIEQSLRIFNAYQTLWSKFCTLLNQQETQKLCARILDDEAFWMLSVAVNAEGVSVSERDKDIPYVSVDITGNSMSPVRKMKFMMISHDQGWGGESGMKDEYEGSYTWFEAGLSTAKEREQSSAGNETQKRGARTSGKHTSTDNEITGIRHIIQRNVRASSRSREHIVTWDYYNEETPEEIRHWMSCIARGDTVNVYPKARYAGWVNYVEFVKVEVYCAWG